ncbi:phosphatidic acid phosphatase type 2/haloperoxidase [Lipomyces kononenkoae]
MARRKASTVRTTLSYIADYVVLITLIAVWSYVSTLPPNFSRFALTDINLQYPIATPETISYGLACGLCIVVPVAIIAFWAIAIDLFRYRSPLRNRLWELNCGILGLALSIALTIVITSSLKAIVGRPRPDVIDRCQPAVGSADAEPFGLSTVDICTQTNRSVLMEGWRSWPSGHSSTAFAGLFYLSLYFAGKLSLFDKRGEVWKMVIVMFPTLGASAIAASRVLDHRHHGTDVLSGALLGIATAWLSYRFYYPGLHDSAREGRAWTVRSWGERSMISSPEVNDLDDDNDDDDAGSMSREEEARVDVEIGQFRRRPTSGAIPQLQQHFEPPSYRGPLTEEYELDRFREHDELETNLLSSSNGRSNNKTLTNGSTTTTTTTRLDDNAKDRVGSGSENPFRSSLE